MDTNEILAIVGLLSAGIWFYWTQKFKPRVEFNIDCEFFFPREASGDVIAEIRLIFNNNGHVQQTLRKLELSIHGLLDQQNIEIKPNTNDVVFNERILPRQSIVPNNWYYWIRPGVNQTITKIVKVNKKHSVIRATAGFSYSGLIRSKHTARRVFQVPKYVSNNA